MSNYKQEEHINRLNIGLTSECLGHGKTGAVAKETETVIFTTVVPAGFDLEVDAITSFLDEDTTFSYNVVRIRKDSVTGEVVFTAYLSSALPTLYLKRPLILKGEHNTYVLTAEHNHSASHALVGCAIGNRKKN